MAASICTSIACISGAATGSGGGWAGPGPIGCCCAGAAGGSITGSGVCPRSWAGAVALARPRGRPLPLAGALPRVRAIPIKEWYK
ncbi:hypothetical protein KY290_009891 [Solanum tuberosum]|uniref:Secreted protein n=1 Tax=Solanum tuberosum TaxID=4113 RepID=A0ABQ7VYC4_SOLTU|nr:hypothetical protein KY290_009891 [Solanum tuberosum]